MSVAGTLGYFTATNIKTYVGENGIALCLLDLSRAPANFWTKVTSSSDVVVYDVTNTTKINRWVDAYTFSIASKTGQLWYTTTLSTTEDTTVNIHVGLFSESNSSTVFTTMSCVMRYSMSTYTTSNILEDSCKVGSYDLTPDNVTNLHKTGKIGESVLFPHSAAQKFYSTNVLSQQNGASTWTKSIIFKPTSFNGIFFSCENGADNITWKISGSNYLAVSVPGNTFNWYNIQNYIVLNQYNYIHIVYNYALSPASRIKLYVNGTLKTCDDPAAYTYPFVIPTSGYGLGKNSSTYYDLYIDELRESSAAYSSGRILNDYNQIFNQTSAVTVGEWQDAYGDDGNGILFSGTGFTSFRAKIKPDFSVKTTLAMSWNQLSSGNWTCVDRGASADKYECENVRLYGNETTINNFINAIEANRTAGRGNNVVTLSGFNAQSKIFGAEVDYSQPITCTINIEDRRRQGSWKGFEQSLTVCAVSPLTFNSTAGALPNFKYIDFGYDADSDRTINKIRSYNNVYTYEDSDADIGTFEGVFTLTVEEMALLRRYISVQRSNTISLPALSGVQYPFGRRSTSYPYAVKIIDFEDLGMLGLTYWRCRIKFAEQYTRPLLAGLYVKNYLGDVISGGDWYPVFNANEFYYHGQPGISSTFVTVNASSSYPITVDGTAVTSGVDSSNIPISVGSNYVNVVVGNTSNYLIEIYR